MDEHTAGPKWDRLVIEPPDQISRKKGFFNHGTTCCAKGQLHKRKERESRVWHRGPEFENKIIDQLQQILGYQKTGNTPYRPQGNSVSERLHATLRSMLAMHSGIKQRNWAMLLPSSQLAYSSSYSSSVKETPSFLILGR